MGRGPCVHSQCTPFGLFVPVLFLTWMWAQRFGHHYLDNFGSMRPALSAGGKFSAMLATATNSIHMESPSPRGSPRAHLGSFKLLPSAPVWLPEVMAKICPGHGEPHGGVQRAPRGCYHPKRCQGRSCPVCLSCLYHPQPLPSLGLADQ